MARKVRMFESCISRVEEAVSDHRGLIRKSEGRLAFLPHLTLPHHRPLSTTLPGLTFFPLLSISLPSWPQLTIHRADGALAERWLPVGSPHPFPVLVTD